MYKEYKGKTESEIRFLITGKKEADETCSHEHFYAVSKLAKLPEYYVPVSLSYHEALRQDWTCGVVCCKDCGRFIRVY